MRAATTIMVARLLAPAALPAARSEEDRLERRARRFYTYYYLNHYDDMWGCFHSSLRERLGDDRKTYIQTLRRSDLELFEAEILGVRIDNDRGAVEVDLTFFYRNVGNPIPRRHRMLWIWENDRWWYAGSQLLQGEKALRGEVLGSEEGAPPETEAEEAPVAYKEVDNVVEVVQGAGIARKVARLRPLAVIKG